MCTLLFSNFNNINKLKYLNWMNCHDERPMLNSSKIGTLVNLVRVSLYGIYIHTMCAHTVKGSCFVLTPNLSAWVLVEVVQGLKCTFPEQFQIPFYCAICGWITTCACNTGNQVTHHWCHHQHLWACTGVKNRWPMQTIYILDHF